MITIAVVNLKGGTTKTTSAVFLAHALHESGQRVGLIDADKQGSSLSWHEYANFPFRVVGMPSKQLHREIPGYADDNRYDVMVIDTPPLEEQHGVVISAMRGSDFVVIPCAPTFMEVERLAAVREALAEAADVRRDGQQPVAAVLLTRTVASAASTGVFREKIAAEGLPVLRAVVGRLERFSQAYGAPVVRASETSYGDALSELLELERTVSS